MKNKRILHNMLTIFFAIFFFFSVLFLPSNISAQGEYENDNTKNLHMRYIKYVYEFLQAYYVDPVSPDVLYKGALEGMLNALGDPYTTYISSDTVIGRDLQDTQLGSFGGIGVTITKKHISTPEFPAYVEVTSPIDGTPGWKAGIQAGDYITEIDGTRTDGINQEEVLAKLRGKPGTEVSLKILRGKKLEFEVKIKRAIIEVPTVKYEMIDNEIGYIKLITFNPNSAPRLEEAIEDLQNKGVKKIIFDLRNNPGGLISSAIDVASVFLHKGFVVSTKSRIPNHNHVYNVNEKIKKLPVDVPLVVLINQGSASSSEIVAGALKDYKRAYLVGNKTYGKGLVQQIVPLSREDSFKFTVSRYYSPSDANIDKLGIPPDLKIELNSFTEEEEKEAMKLLKSNDISKFTHSKKEITKQEMENFAKKLKATYNIREKLLMIMIRSEYSRNHVTPIFDLEYDEELKASYELLKNKNVLELCKSTKTTYELQQQEKKTDKVL